MSRLKELRTYVDKKLNKMDDEDKRISATAHLYGVSMAAQVLAKKRGLDPELAAMAGMLKERLGQAISIIPGKSESWLMLAIEGDIPMYFRGDDSQPTAFIEVKIYGNASSDTYGKMTKELTGIYGDILVVTPDHMYIRYFGSEDWGWNGSNF